MQAWWRRDRRAARRTARAYVRTTGRPGLFVPAGWLAGRGLLTAAAVALVLGGGCLGVRAYLRSSGVFTLRRIVITADETLQPEMVREYLGVREGMPLFGLDIGRRRADMLRDAPAIRDLDIWRTLPDTLSVRISERQPLVRFGRSSLVADATGHVFTRHSGIESLPSVAGYETLGLEPGQEVTAMARAAVELLAVVAEGGVPLQVVEVDIAHEDYIRCIMWDQRQARIAWKGMGTDTAVSRAALRQRLVALATAMASERGRGRTRWDVTVAGRVYAL